MDDRTCSFPDCLKPFIARGWCTQHYQRWQKYGTPFVQEQIQGDNWTRFWSKVGAGEALCCWEWRGGSDKDGYGLVRMSNATQRAHRASWEFLRGEIPDDPTTGKPLVLDHLCRNRICVNPWHLDPVPSQINTRRAQPWLDAGMFKCGHARIPANTRPTTTGSSACVACARANSRFHYAKRCGRPYAFEFEAARYFAEIMANAA